MSIRRYCDVCHAEIGRNYVHDRLKGTVRRAGDGVPATQIEVMLGTNGAWNGGDLCKACLAAALTQLLADQQ